MNPFLKHYATPLVVAGFLAIACSGLIMFFDLDAPGLKDVHRWLGLIFVGVALLHLVWNWRGMTIRLRQTRTVAVIGMLTLAAAGVIGYVQVSNAGKRGENGFRMALNAMAQAPLSASAPALGVTPDIAMARLKAKGLTVAGANESLRDIAKANDRELPALYATVIGQQAQRRD